MKLSVSALILRKQLYASVSNEIHQTLKARYFFYNAFKDVLFK